MPLTLTIPKTLGEAYPTSGLPAHLLANDGEFLAVDQRPENVFDGGSSVSGLSYILFHTFRFGGCWRSRQCCEIKFLDGLRKSHFGVEHGVNAVR